MDFRLDASISLIDSNLGLGFLFVDNLLIQALLPNYILEQFLSKTVCEDALVDQKDHSFASM